MASCMLRDRSVLALVTLIGATLLLNGCGGGGGGGGGGNGGQASIVSVSFQGTPSTPGGPIPPVFRDEILLFTLDAPLDAGILGGFVTTVGATTPTIFVGASSFSLTGVPYFAFVDQTSALASLQIIDNGTGVQATNVVIGRHATDSRTLVVDPKIQPGNLFGLTASLGFAANTQFDVFIPAVNSIRVGGNPIATFGAPPPVVPPGFSQSPPPSTLFLTGPAFVPDTVPPQVLEITSLAVVAAGGTPQTVPIPTNDTFRITFSEPIDVSTLNLLRNIIVRNLSVTTPLEPTGAIVPMSLMANASATVFTLTPQPAFGAGPFQIRVEVGTNLDNADDIRDLPAGVNATQNPLANSLSVTFTTIAAPGTPTAVSLSETFDTTTNQDGTFIGRYNNLQWDVANSNRLNALPISGSAQPGAVGGLGTRVQFPIQVTSGNPGVVGWFSPFDDSNANNFGAQVNPMGGSHSQFLYVAQPTFTELPNGLTDTIELVEWGPCLLVGMSTACAAQSNVFAYNTFSMRLAHTTAGFQVGTTGAPLNGLQTVFSLNYDADNPQNEWIMPTSHPSPMGSNLLPNMSPITVVPAQTYNVPLLASLFVPFPALNPTFDFDDGGRTFLNQPTNSQQQPNIVVDVDIPAPVAPNFNFLRGSNPGTPNPIRRVNAAGGALLGANADNVANHMRFTIVAKNSSARTIFYDLTAQAQDANFSSLTLIPDVSLRPAGTSVIVRIEAADGVTNNMPTTPVGGMAPTGVVTYINQAGNVIPGALDLMDGRRFFRVIFELESNTNTNVGPFVDGMIVGYTF